MYLILCSINLALSTSKRARCSSGLNPELEKDLTFIRDKLFMTKERLASVRDFSSFVEVVVEGSLPEELLSAGKELRSAYGRLRAPPRLWELSAAEELEGIGRGLSSIVNVVCGDHSWCRGVEYAFPFIRLANIRTKVAFVADSFQFLVQRYGFLLGSKRERFNILCDHLSIISRGLELLHSDISLETIERSVPLLEILQSISKVAQFDPMENEWDLKFEDEGEEPSYSTKVLCLIIRGLADFKEEFDGTLSATPYTLWLTRGGISYICNYMELLFILLDHDYTELRKIVLGISLASLLNSIGEGGRVSIEGCGIELPPIVPGSWPEPIFL